MQCCTVVKAEMLKLHLNAIVARAFKGVDPILCNQNFVSWKFFNTSVYLKKNNNKKKAIAKQALLALVQVNQQKRQGAAQLIAWREASTLQTLLANIELCEEKGSILMKPINITEHCINQSIPILITPIEKRSNF